MTGPSVVNQDEITKSDHPLVGSVQTMYKFADDGAEYLLAVAPDKGSVFDIGTVFAIPDSGKQRNTLRHRVYTRLMDPDAWRGLTAADFQACFSDPDRIRALQESATFERLVQNGARTHHLGLVEPGTGRVVSGYTDLWSDSVVMESYPVIKPQRVTIAGVPAYDYSDYRDAETKLVALEHIVRRGNPGGSSLQGRYDRLAQRSPEETEAFLTPFGIAPPLKSWSILPNLAVEWSTKFEGYDRYISTQEALLIAGVDAATFNKVVDLLLLATLQVNSYIATTNLELWDLKWELAITNDEIVIVDTMDHDSMRLTLRFAHELAGPCVVHFNKQAVRDYYKIFHADWHSALEDAKRRSNLPGSGPFKEVYRKGVDAGEYPDSPDLDQEFADLQSRKYALVTSGPDADPAQSQKLASEEVEYYSARGKLDAFRRFNSIPAPAS